MNNLLISHILAALPMVIVAALALGFVALTAARPVIGCAVFAFSTSLTTGLGRGTIIPLLRPNEAVLLLLLVGLTLHYLPRRQRRAVTSLDLAVGTFTIGAILIPFLVLFLSRSPDLQSIDTVRSVLAPVQFLIVYLIFSRTELSQRGIVTVLNLTMLASLIVAAIAMAEALDLPGVRGFVLTYYPPPSTVTGWDPAYRPFSTLGHYSAVGAFGTLNFLLALALATIRHPAFSRVWLAVVITVNLAAVVASNTWAPLLALPVSTAIVLWYGRRVPRELGVAVVAMAAAFVVFSSAVLARTSEQHVGTTGVAIPTTFEYRMHFWEEFFVPSLSGHEWFGTGTVIPSSVPDRLVNFVDNEYLREMFRGGIVGLGLLFMLVITIAVVAWRLRASPGPTHRSLGATVLACVAFFALIGMTAEYLFFGGVSQEFAMLLGLLTPSYAFAAAGVPFAATARPLPLVGARA